MDRVKGEISEVVRLIQEIRAEMRLDAIENAKRNRQLATLIDEVNRQVGETAKVLMDTAQVVSDLGDRINGRKP